MMTLRKKLWWGGGVVGVSALGGLIWWWLHISAAPIQYQSQKTFSPHETSKETLSETPAEVAKTDAPVDTAAPVAQTETQPAAKPEPKAAIAQETVAQKEEDSKDITPKDFRIQDRKVNFGFEAASDRDINAIVLHSSHSVSGDPYDVSAVIALWRSYGVAPHYMIARDGTVYRLVDDKNIAYHAGDSVMPDGRTGVNQFSIGVEILNTKTDEYTSAQYQATKDLIRYLRGKYGKMSVVGHSTIAPGRKTDPWNFDWNKL
jgi:hypothetical protein